MSNDIKTYRTCAHVTDKIWDATLPSLCSFTRFLFTCVLNTASLIINHLSTRTKFLRCSQSQCGVCRSSAMLVSGLVRLAYIRGNFNWQFQLPTLLTPRVDRGRDSRASSSCGDSGWSTDCWRPSWVASSRTAVPLWRIYIKGEGKTIYFFCKIFETSVTPVP